MRVLAVLLILMSVGASAAHGQTHQAIVPDLVGLSVPQAAAALNAAGLLLGDEITLSWAEGDSLRAGSVVAQSHQLGALIDAGSAVSITVLRAPNMRLIYGETFLTLLSTTDAPVDLTRLSFADVNSITYFMATRLLGELRPGACAQVWSVPRLGPQQLAECQVIARWQTTSNTREHFWTGANGIEEFVVMDDNVPVVNCPAAQVGADAGPISCEFYYSGAAAGTQLADYLYFSYTPEAFAVINVSDGSWMPTDMTTLLNFNPQLSIPGLPVVLGDPELFQEQFRHGMGDVARLAPGQCLVVTTAATEEAAAPEPCHVIAQRDLSPEVAFWLADFEVEGSTSEMRAACPGATADELTVCIVPR